MPSHRLNPQPRSCPGRTRFRLPLCAFLLTLFAFPAFAAQPPAAADHKPSQDDVQAVYLYDFAKFIHWPANAHTGALNICVAGPRSYEDALDKIVTGESIDGRALATRHIDRPDQVADCDILFIDDTVKDRLDSFLTPLAGKPVLTVSDAPRFIDRGGMVQFVLVDNRVRFAVNLAPASRSGISLSSELLKVAVSVKGRSGGAQ